MQGNSGIMSYDLNSLKMSQPYDYQVYSAAMYDTRLKGTGLDGSHYVPPGTTQFPDGYMVNPTQEQVPSDQKQDTCRDYLRGKCLRGVKCKYRHPDSNEISGVANVNNPRIIFCRNFQRGKCNLANCRYIHSSRTDEEFYYQTGRLPQHIDNFMPSQNDNYNNYIPPMTNQIPATFSNNPLQLSGQVVSSANTNMMDMSSLVATDVHNLISEVESQGSSSIYRLSNKPDQHSQSPPLDQDKIPSQKTLSQSSNSISDYNGDKTPGSKTRRWSLDHENNVELNSKHSPLYTSLRDEAFKNGEVDTLKIRICQLEEKIKTLDFYNEMLREQNVQLKQQVKRHENPFSPIYKPIIQSDTDIVN